VQELKHDKNQNVHDAMAQFGARNHAHKIFQHPFLYLAADTCDVMAFPPQIQVPKAVSPVEIHRAGGRNAPTN
jgi:type I restriction enzyme R subunit